MTIVIWQATHTASAVSGHPAPSVLLNVAGSGIGGCRGRKEKKEKDPLKAAGGWAQGKKGKKRGVDLRNAIDDWVEGKKKKKIVIDPLEDCWELGVEMMGARVKKKKKGRGRSSECCWRLGARGKKEK